MSGDSGLTRLRVGVVGCGEVAQIIHIPTLQQLRSHFDITALCDVSEPVLQGVAAQAPGAALHTDVGDLVRSDSVDAVLVANPNVFHAAVAIAAMEGGKDVLIEKPMCVTLAEAEALADAERRTGRIVQIGYMRRYAGALQEAAALLSGLRSSIRLVCVHDVIGRNSLIVDSTSEVVRMPDPDGSRAQALRTIERVSYAEALGVVDDTIATSYSMLLGLSSHDLSAMRELLGTPRRVLGATRRHDGRFVTATFEYGDFVCLFSTGLDEIPRYDTHIEIFADTKVIRVDYDTPYVRSLPARLTVVEGHGPAGVASSTSYPTRLDAFVTEWLAFHRHVTDRTRPVMNIDDAREDLVLALAIMREIEAGQRTRESSPGV